MKTNKGILPDASALGSSSTGSETTTVDEEQVPRKEATIYGLGTLGDTCMSQSIGQLVMPILNIGLGVSPVLIGNVLAARTLWDAFNDPFVGHMGDNFRSRYGRRRPFILVGGITSAFLLCFIWLFPSHWDAAHIMIWFGITLFMLSITQTVFSTAYYALGIEMAPSYHERTRIVAYRGFVQKVASLLVPWFLPFTMLSAFGSEIVGVRVLSLIIAAVVAILSVVTYFGTKERTHVDVHRKKEKFLTAVRGVAKNVHFLRISAIFALMVSLFALFSVFGAYVNIYYVYGGDKLKGASISAVVGSLGAILAMLGIPLVAWMSKRFQKHNALKFSLWLMIIGEVLKFFVMRPETPWAQIIIPFFFSLGVSCIFTILGSMQADVVDMDELASGQRREGIFGAMAGWMMKSAGALATALSGYFLLWTGFDAALGAAQSESTFLWLRVMNSFAPAIMASTCLLLLYKYPLTEARMEEVKKILVRRRAEAESNSVETP